MPYTMLLFLGLHPYTSFLHILVPSAKKFMFFSSICYLAHVRATAHKCHIMGIFPTRQDASIDSLLRFFTSSLISLNKFHKAQIKKKTHNYVRDLNTSF